MAKARHREVFLAKLSLPWVLALLSSASASRIGYTIDFTVTEVKEMHSGWAQGPAWCADCYQFRPDVGRVFQGAMVIEDSLLSRDGDRIGGLVSLELNLAGVRWDYDALAGNSGSLCGFRSSQGLGSVSPSFMVTNGELAGWMGGVYGGGDYPFIDFSGSGFASVDGNLSGVIMGETRFTPVNPVPEPNTAIYLAMGLGWMFFSLRRRGD